jgi:hypothetical protein
MKPFAFYRHPFTNEFSRIDRREAAQLFWQWRRTVGKDGVRHLVCGERRAYTFHGVHGETAALILKETELVTG